MTTSHRLPRVWPVIVVVLLGPAVSVALAQTSSGGTDAPAAVIGAPLRLVVSMFSARESTPVDLSSVPPEQGRASVSLGYSRATRRSTFDLSAGSVVPYSAGATSGIASYSGGVHFSTRFGRRTRLDAVESISQRPLDLSGLIGLSSVASSGAPDAVRGVLTTSASLIAAREMRHDGAISVTRTLSRRSSAALSYTHTNSSSVGLRSASSQVVAIRVDHRVSASSAFHAGYGFGSASFDSAEARAGVRHDIDLGLDYTRPLPFSGRTLFGAGTGSTILSDGGSHRLRLTPYGRLSRDLGREWSSAFEYTRPMQFVAGFREPFLSDAVNLRVSGRLGGAWFTSITSGAARGAVGFGPTRGAYESLTGSVRVDRQIARAWRLEAEAFATHFRFVATERFDVALPPRLTRQGVRAGFSWSTALLRR